MGGAREGHRDNIRSSAGAVYLWKLCCLDHSRLQSKKLNDLSLPLKTTIKGPPSRDTLASLTALPLANSSDDDDDKIKSLHARRSFTLGLTVPASLLASADEVIE